MLLQGLHQLLLVHLEALKDSRAAPGHPGQYSCSEAESLCIMLHELSNSLASGAQEPPACQLVRVLACRD